MKKTTLRKLLKLAKKEQKEWAAFRELIEVMLSTANKNGNK